MASIAQAVTEAGQKKRKTAREQLEVIESNKKSVNRKRKQLVASASEPRNKKQGVPVQDVADNVAGSAVSNTVNRKNAEEHINKGPEKSSTKHKHTTSSSKPKSTNSKSVTKEVTSKK